MIVTLTCNPCLDRTYEGGLPIDEMTGGKGINVARVLSRLGTPCVAVAPVGRGPLGERFKELAKEEGIYLLPVPVEGDMRVIDTLKDTGEVRYDPGSDIREDEIEEMRKALWQVLPGARLLIVSGSAPGPKLTAFAREAIGMAKHLGLATLLDANGPALIEGAKERPDMLKPNEKELEQLLGHPYEPGKEEEAGRELIERYHIPHIIVSLGENGAVWLQENTAIYCPAPKITTVNAVGSGDCFTAALCHVLLQGATEYYAMTYACAAGAANAAVFPAAKIGPEDIAKMLS